MRTRLTNTSQFASRHKQSAHRNPQSRHKQQAARAMGRKSGGEEEARWFGSMEEFWGFYLGQHSKPATRRWHFVGTLASLACALLAAATGRAALLLACPVLGYGMAWYSHFFVEGNRPATFGHPVWSLLCDYRMFALILTGRIDAELARLRIQPPREDAPAAPVHQD